SISELAREIDHYTEENIRLAQERERVEAELDMAKEIQTSQLPEINAELGDGDRFDIYAIMTPAKEVGGDFYDFFKIDDDHLALVIADVSDKGVPAALFMMMSKILINNYAMMGLSPGEVLEHANNSICQNNKRKMFVTVWFGILEISSGKITASNAGHEYPVICQPKGEFELLKDKHGFVLGAKPGKKYTDYEITLKKGGTLFVYTDGVPEAINSREEMLGTSGMIQVLNESPDSSPRELLERVQRALTDYAGDVPQFDDTTMLCIKLV
ncbi:MAG: serine/threonine-protein phosphatase, partial [Lachnospiraceae bacterium]|nr:serine/threonine-protein phosphatase [Lachnospiraceae bacterium]